MYLNNLIIESLENDVEIRNIPFKKGLNLILDKGSNQKTGNDIGKTTFLRSIDFCLGSASNELFVDRDENKSNDIIKSFLTKNKVSFTLSIGYQFGRDDLILKRWFTGEENSKGNPSVEQSINGEILGIRKYTSQLNNKIFHTDGKPSFRDLIPKFIREEKNSIGSLLRYHGKFKSNEEYNSIHLLLFGFKNSQLLEEKNILSTTIKDNETKKQVYISDYGNENTLVSKISIKEGELDNEVKKRNTLQQKIADISNLKTDLEEFNQIAKIISDLNNKIITTEIDIDNIHKTINRLKTEAVSADNQLIFQLYTEAKIYNEKINKDFNEILNFHNKMINNKIHFSQKSLEHKKTKYDSLKEKRDLLIKDYELTKDSKNEKLFDELNTLNDQILYISNELKIIKNANENIKSYSQKVKDDTIKLNEVLTQIENDKDSLQTNINTFNRYFSTYTKKLYGDEYFVYFGDDLSKPFEINTKYNPGDGKKKAVITAFDLAYAAFLSETKLGYPKFIAEDQMELIDLQQLEELFNISNKLDVQLIIPVLSSKINQINNLSTCEILKLSDSDKFFKF